MYMLWIWIFISFYWCWQFLDQRDRDWKICTGSGFLFSYQLDRDSGSKKGRDPVANTSFHGSGWSNTDLLHWLSAGCWQFMTNFGVYLYIHVYLYLYYWSIRFCDLFLVHWLGEEIEKWILREREWLNFTTKIQCKNGVWSGGITFSRPDWSKLRQQKTSQQVSVPIQATILTELNSFNLSCN